MKIDRKENHTVITLDKPTEQIIIYFKVGQSIRKVNQDDLDRVYITLGKSC